MVKKVLVFVGTRPEAIKLAPVVRELKNYPESFSLKVCSTGQHKEMLAQVFSDLEFSPDISLGVMTNDQTLSSLTSKLFEGISQVLIEEKPDWIIVQGDTTTVMVASICAYYFKVRVAHIEAGLRSRNKWSPFPEEMNRRLVSVLADLHFAPTITASENLVKEGINPANIVVSGNTGIDSLFWVLAKYADHDLGFSDSLSEMLGSRMNFILITGHRRENQESGLSNLCEAIKILAVKYPELYFVYPVHLNPRVQKTVYESLGAVQRVLLCDPLPYRQFVKLISSCFAIITDSGGIQEECLALKKPVLVIRTETERPEGIEAGGSLLIGTQVKNIVSAVEKLILNTNFYESMKETVNPYGDGNSAALIVNELRFNT
jgi:UDP-N-acetylglucosamine 2-epimerase (non-hydrolysing)